MATILVSPAPALGATAESTIIRSGSADWSYYRGSTAPASDWKTSKGDWRTGAAPLGSGTNTGTLGTRISNDFTVKPRATYFKKSFDLNAVPEGGLTLQTRADDGIILFVNGTEVRRTNLPTGTIKHSSYATKAPQTSTAIANPVNVTIPASALVAGTNILSAQVQSNWQATHNITFDAKLTGVLDATSAPAPVVGSEDLAGWGTPDWRDEFDYRDSVTGKPAVDPKKWNVRDRSDLGLLFDAAVVDDGQVSVDSSGIAHLRADWLDTPVIRPSTQSGPRELWHKTGYMDQRNLGADNVSAGQRWGRWEIRAKVPTGPQTYGALAAFWLRNSNSGEIDIMEAWGYNQTAAPGGQRIDTATTTVHTQTSGSGNQKYIWHHSDYGAAKPVWDGFHTYAFELTPTYAAIFFDGKKIATATPATHPNLWDTRYFNSPLHMRLNLHVGPSATYWGLPNPNNREWTKPLDFQVDYVRTWNYTP